MQNNRVFPESAEPQPESAQDVEAKVIRLLAQIPAGARKVFYEALHRSLNLSSNAVIELAPAGPRVIDPRRVIFVEKMPRENPPETTVESAD